MNPEKQEGRPLATDGPTQEKTSTAAEQKKSSMPSVATTTDKGPRRSGRGRHVHALPGFSRVRNLPLLHVNYIEPVPGRTQHRVIGRCACGYVHVFGTSKPERLLAGVATRRCPVERVRYRLVVRAYRQSRRSRSAT